MKCIKCGRENKDADKFCFLCGSRLGVSEKDLQGFHFNFFPFLITGIVFVLLVILSKYLN